MRAVLSPELKATEIWIILGNRMTFATRVANKMMEEIIVIMQEFDDE